MVNDKPFRGKLFAEEPIAAFSVEGGCKIHSKGIALVALCVVGSSPTYSTKWESTIYFSRGQPENKFKPFPKTWSHRSRDRTYVS